MTAHTHDHIHAGPSGFGTAFAAGIALNFIFVLAGVAFGIIGHSMALIADAGHNLGDVLGLVVAWGASALARRAPTPRYTYGLRSSSILAALFNAVFLLIATGAIAVEAVRRLFMPQPVAGDIVMLVAGIGIFVNLLTALLFARGRNGDLNIRAAFLHMTGDAAVSVGVVVAGGLILLTHAQWIDPIVSLAIAAAIVAGTWGVLRDSLSMTLHAVPPGVDAVTVRSYLTGLPGVCAIHDLHIWPMSTTETALTCHLVMPGGHPGDGALHEIADQLHNRFGIPHATIQVETGTEDDCALASDHTI